MAYGFDPRMAHLGMGMLNGPSRSAVPSDDEMMRDATQRRDPIQEAFSATKPRAAPSYPGQPAQQRQVSLLDMLRGNGGNLYPLGTTAPPGGSGAIQTPWLYV